MQRTLNSIATIFFAACKNNRHIQEKDVVAETAHLNRDASEIIHSALEDAETLYINGDELSNTPLANSLTLWLPLKEKHVISMRKRMPLYIRYFDCDGVDKRVVFCRNVYGGDRRVKSKIFYTINNTLCEEHSFY